MLKRLWKNWMLSELDRSMNNKISNSLLKNICLLSNENLPLIKKIGKPSKKMLKQKWKNRFITSDKESKKTRLGSTKPSPRLPTTSKARPMLYLRN